MDQFSKSDFEQWITVKKGLVGNSIRICLSRIDILLKWLKTSHLELNIIAAESFIYHLKKRGYKNNSINTYIFSFRYLQDYFKARQIEIDFFGELKCLPKEKPEIDILTPEEIERLLSTDLAYGKFRGKDVSGLNEIYKAVTTFLAFTGCRFEEMANLTVNKVDLAGGFVTFIDTKNKENRRIGLSPILIKILREYVVDKNPHDLVFINMAGSPIISQNYIPDLHKRAKKAGIYKRVYPHLFRHSFATQLLMSGVDISIVASVLGHKDIQTTFGSYTHLADLSIKRGMMRHPLIRKSLPARDKLLLYIQEVKELGFMDDEDIDFNIHEGNKELKLNLKIK